MFRGWNCAATYYWDNTGTYAGHDAGIGIFNVSHWDNSYPGASDMGPVCPKPVMEQ